MAEGEAAAQGPPMRSEVVGWEEAAMGATRDDGAVPVPKRCPRIHDEVAGLY